MSWWCGRLTHRESIAVSAAELLPVASFAFTCTATASYNPTLVGGCVEARRYSSSRLTSAKVTVPKSWSLSKYFSAGSSGERLSIYVMENFTRRAPPPVFGRRNSNSSRM